MQVIKDVFAFGREPEWCSPGKHLRIVLGIRIERGTRMRKIRFPLLCATFLFLLLLSAASTAAQAATSQDDDGPAIFGSIFLSVLNFPLKLATCVGTQAVSAVAYTATYGVQGNYDGGTNGRDIGEVARKSCTGWLISPDQVKKDYYQ
jgi:hypothetical protein